MGDYVDIGPVHMWYEHRGEGEPLLLLHGGLDTNALWVAQLEALVGHYRVYAPERRGHGHTADVDGRLSYDVMAHDMVAFVDKVVGEPVRVVGWSDGAIVGLLMAMARPDLVRSLVLIGGAADVAGYVPEFHKIARLPGDSEEFQSFRAVYGAVSPDGPEHWPVVFGKVTAMWQSEPHLPVDDLEAVRAATLLVCGDDDLVSLEHTVAMYRAIPGAELAVIPGTSHLAPLEKPDLVNRVLLDFLRGETVPEVLPVRRAPARV